MLASNVDLGSTALVVVVGETDAVSMDEFEHAIARSAKIAVMGARVITDLDRNM